MVSFLEKRFLSVGLMLLISSSSFVSCHEGEKSGEKPKTTITKDSEVVEDLLYVTPKSPASAYLTESFDDSSNFRSRWIISDARKEDADDSIAKYDGQWSVESALESALKGDLGLVLKSKAKHHAISSKFSRPFVFDKKPLVVQYEVNFQNGQECGGAYLKLLTDSKDLNLKKFQDKTQYTIMFGPDKCGNDAKLHFIFQHRNPVNATLSEKHCKKPTASLDEYFKDKKPHLYTLVLNPDNTFEVLVDNVVVNQGDLLQDFTPPVNPPAEIDDPNDTKPADWDEREKIVDPEAKKPEDWNEDAPRQIPDPSAVKPSDWLDEESETIPDPNAEKPSDWDDEMDGEWEAPLINNPKCEKVGCGEWKAPMVENPEYKGKWYAPFIDNPNYQGRWKPKRIANPDFFNDKNPFKMSPIGAVGLELWSMSDGIYFDNILVVDDKRIAEQFAKETWELKKKKGDSDSLSFWSFVTFMCKKHPRYVWFVYFVYVAIPIIYYVRIMQRWLKEEGLVTRIMNYTNSHPWLYAVYVVVIGLPLVLIVVFCCSSEDKNKKRVSGRSKKTDEVTLDDSSAKFEEADEDGIDADDSKNSLVSEKSSHTVEEDDDDDTAAAAAAAAEGAAKNSEGEEEEEEEDVDVGVEEYQENADGEPEIRRSARKRKPRKD